MQTEDVDLGQAFFDEGADFCGVSEKFVKKQGWTKAVVDRGTLEVTYANGKTETVENKVIPLTVFVENMPGFEYEFHVCHIPNDCDLMLGVPWKRTMLPIIDWETDRIYTRDEYLEEQQRLTTRSKNKTQSATEENRTQTCGSRRSYYSKRFGFTKNVTLKSARKLVRKNEVEFVVLLPPETVNALYVEAIDQRKESEDIQNLERTLTEKQRRLEKTDISSFRGTPAESLVEEFSDIFRTELPSGLPVHGEHEMDIKPGTGAIYRQQWRLSPEQEQAVREWTKEMLRVGLIRPSKSPHAAPTFCIKKPVGWRIVHDYRAMNEQTIRQSTPMPRKDAIFDRMSGCYWYSCFDLLSGYYQLRMREKDIPFTAFQTPDGLFEYIAIPMGLSNAPATFNRIVQRIFEDLRDHVATYFDDIYVFTKGLDVDSHLAAVRQVFERCREEKLYLKLAKSTICAAEIPCLGDFVGRNGVRIDPDKVRVITEWPLPKTTRELQSFLGTTVYVQRFCASYSELSAPLFAKLKKKGTRELKWNKEEQNAFSQLKTALSSTPVLALPDFTKPFFLRTDASRFAVGGVLFQMTMLPGEKTEREQPIAFCGRKMKPAELNYPTHEQEMLAIVHCLSIWRVYLLDGGCIVETDHHSLERVLTQKTINRRICRWYDLLSEFKLRFRYIPGSTNIVADALSRRPDFEIDFRNRRTIQMNAARRLKPNTLLDLIRRAQRVAGLTKEVERTRKQGEKTYIFDETDSLVYVEIRDQRRIVIPRTNTELQNTILWELHDIRSAGHPGFEKTLHAVQARFFWEKMHKTIKAYIRTCESCQRNKTRPGKPPGLLHPLEIPTGRWSSIGMDFMTGLPTTQRGHDTILVITDRLTKRAHFTETVSTISAKELAELFVRVYVRHHGLPSDIVSDRDSKFTSEFWSSCAEILGTKLKLATAHHQRTDGQVERVNAILAGYLRHYVSGFQNDWDEHLSIAEFAYNSQYQASIEMSPFYADLGYHPRLPVDMHLPKAPQTPATTFLLQMEAILRKVQAQLRTTAEKMKLYYDRGRREQKFSVGDMVLVATNHFTPATIGAVQRKFAAKWIGPYEVIRVLQDGTSYELNIPQELRIHPVFHTMVLKKFQKDTSGASRDSTIPPVRLKDGSIGHLIEKIIGYRLTKNGTEQYQCKWVGRADDITWEPTANVLSVPGLIREYHREAQGRPTRKSARLRSQEIHRRSNCITVRQWTVPTVKTSTTSQETRYR